MNTNIRKIIVIILINTVFQRKLKQMYLKSNEWKGRLIPSSGINKENHKKYHDLPI